MSELTPFTGAASSIAPAVDFSRSVSKSVKRGTEGVLARAEVVLATDVARAGLAHSALQNTGALVVTASALMDVAPQGGDLYAAIVTGYATGAAHAVARFQ